MFNLSSLNLIKRKEKKRKKRNHGAQIIATSFERAEAGFYLVLKGVIGTPENLPPTHTV